MNTWEWRAQYKQGSTWYTLGSIQTVDIMRGRELQIDDYSIDTGNLRALNPSTWTNPPKLGDPICFYVYAPGYVVGVTDFPMFWGRIRDVKIDYGQVAKEDVAHISCEGIQADWGRAQLNSFALTQQKTDDAVLAVATQVGLPVAQFNGRSTISATTFTGNGLDLINRITRTEEGRMFAYGATITGTWYTYWYGRNSVLTTVFYMNDGTCATTTLDQKYDQIEFRSSADNYYNLVTITPEAVAAQTSTAGTTPLYSWQKNTLDYSTTQAADHATWVRKNFENKNQAIASISYTDTMQPQTNGTGAQNATPLDLAVAPIQNPMRIGFRGTFYYVMVEGVRISASPGQTRVTLFTSGQDQNAYLILNNSTYGQLDYNKLGF